MSDFEAAARDGSSQRLGDGERSAVVEALDAHRQAGRLTSEEFEDRQVQASRARTWAEVRPLFDDLPAPHPQGMPPVPTSSGYVPAPLAGATGEVEPGGLLGGLVKPRYRSTVMALTPFVALALFFTTEQWLWFLLIPVVGILLYGPDGNEERKRLEREQRRQDRDRRRGY
jgi:hypothetical protein